MTRNERAAALAVAATAAALLAGAFTLDARTALAAYLVAWVAASAVPIGALGLLLMTYVVRRAWTEELHGILAVATSTLPVCGLLLIPVLIGQGHLYPAAAGHAALPPFKAAYLAPWFLALRAVAFIAIWSLLAIAARRAFGDDARMVRIASAGLIVYALTVSLAGVDWLESLAPDFHSSIYGLLYMSFVLLAALAFGLGWVLWRGRIPPRGGYGALLLADLLLWAYLHAMQYIVIWAGNVPDEVTWYLDRVEGGWAWLLALLIFAQFVGPFFVLLGRQARHSRRVLAVLCALTLAMRVIEAVILALPGLDDLNVPLVAGALVMALAFILSVLALACDMRLGATPTRARAGP